MRLHKLFETALLGVSALLTSVNAIPLSEDTLEGRQTATTPVVGVTGNGVQVRMELRVMQQQQPDMFNIYLLGLQHMMQTTSNTDPLSYYQVAGVFCARKIFLDNLLTCYIRYSRQAIRSMGQCRKRFRLWWWILHAHF